MKFSHYVLKAKSIIIMVLFQSLCTSGVIVLFPMYLNAQSESVISDSTGSALLDSVGVEKESESIVSAPEDSGKGITPTYASPWIGIDSLSEKQQKARIVDKVKAILEAIKSDYKTESYLSEIARLNAKWYEEKKQLNEAWLNEFLSKESKLYKSHQSLGFIIQDTIRLSLEIESKKRELEKIKNTIESHGLLKDELNKWIKKNAENLASRLSYLSLSTVVLARIETDITNDNEQIYRALSNKMLEQAVEEIKGYDINSLTMSVDTTYQKYISKKIEGNTQISDTYYKPIFITTPDKKLYLYKVHRIDVFPFKRNNNNNSSSGINASDKAYARTDDFYDEIEAFIVRGDTVESGQSNRSRSLSEFRLPESAINYIHTQYQISSKSKNKIVEKINKFKKEYAIQDSSYKNELSEEEEKIRELETKQSDLLKDLEADIRKLESLRHKLYGGEQDGLLKAYQKNRDEYEAFYKNRISYVNKIEQKKIKFGSPDDVAEMANNSFSVVKDIKKSNISNEVLLELTDSTETIRTLIAKPIEYSADVISFRIIYLTIISSSGDIYFLLNIAYKVRWSSEPEIVIDQAHKSIKTPGLNLEWKVFNTDPASIRVPGSLPFQGGWRYPTFKELLNLSPTIAKYADDKGENPFTMLGWPLDFPYMSEPKNRFFDENNYPQISCYDFEKYCRVNLYPEETVYVIYVRSTNLEEEGTN